MPLKNSNASGGYQLSYCNRFTENVPLVNLAKRICWFCCLFEIYGTKNSGWTFSNQEKCTTSL